MRLSAKVVGSRARRGWLAGVIGVAAFAAACGPDPQPREDASSPPLPAPEAAPAAAAAPEPFALRRPVCLTETPHRVAYVGEDARVACDVVAVPAGEASGPVLAIARDEHVGDEEAHVLRGHAARGALLYVDAWAGDADRLLRLVPGGTLRDLRADEPPLAGPRPLARVPEAHENEARAGDPRIVAVERDGRVRLVATAQSTLTHSCSCPALEGRRRFAQNLAAFAVALTPAAAPDERPAVVGRTVLDGLSLRTTATFRAPPRAAASVRLEVLSLDGAVVARAERSLDAGASASLEAAATLASPFEVLDHRVVATLTTDDAILRDVRPLASLVGVTDLRVLGMDTLRAGGPGTVRVMVRNSLRGAPVAGARVAIALLSAAGLELARAEGVSDDAGTAPLVMQIPAGAPDRARLVAEARSALTTDRAEADVSIGARRAAHVFLDLPIHAPGDEVRARALVVEQPSGRPAAGRRFTFAVERGGEIVGDRADATTDAFGVAAGSLRIPAGERASDCAVVVSEAATRVGSTPLRIERFEVPTFEATLGPAAPAWTSDATLPVSVACARFDGRPIGDASVSVELRAASDATTCFAWTGRTDARGVAKVSVRPARDVAGRAAGYLLLVEARDAGGRSVRTHVAVPPVPRDATAAEVALLLPDGPLTPGRRGRVLLHAPGRTGGTIDIALGDGAPRSVALDAFGLAEFAIDDPQPGRAVATGQLRLPVPLRDGPVALVLGRRVAGQGERIALRVTSTVAADHAFVDLVRDDAVVATDTLRLEGGEGAGEIRLPDDVVGPVLVHAYVVPTLDDGSGGGLAGDARAALVVPHETLRVAVEPARREVRPGQAVGLAVRVTDPEGGVPAALAVRVADEAVLSLVAADPECARMALVLDESVRRAPMTLCGVSAAEIASRAARRALTDPERRVADALFALLDRAVRYRLDRVTLPVRLTAYEQRVQTLFAAWRRAQTDALFAALRGPHAPAPSETIRDVATALAAAEERGAFGRDGILDPWGGCVRWGVGEGALQAGSAGPDAIEGTPDDPEDAWTQEQTVALHAAWLEARGVAFDPAEVLRIYSSRFSGRGGGGAGGSSHGWGGGAGRRVPASPPARMRRFFPAALFWSPALRTGADGRADLVLRAPDSLTTWRVDVVASDAAGRVAEGTSSFVTTQPFAVDADPPAVLVAGDEVEVPVLLRTDRPDVRSVAVTAEVAGAGSLASAGAFDLRLDGPGERAAPVRVKALVPGALILRLSARAGGDADAVERVVSVLPAGREVVRSAPFLAAAGGGPARAALPALARSIAGAERAEVRIAASPVAAVLQGVESLLEEPHGCFEQTSSALYPDVLALRYLRRTDGGSPEIEARFDAAIDSGIAKLLAFEIRGGGFDWFGRAPAKPLLTAYGLHEWIDLAAVRTSARDVAERTAAWLASTQRPDGSFPLTDAPYAWKDTERGATAATAYVAWALARTGRHDDSVDQALALLRERVETESDPYALALAAAALAERDAKDPAALAVARRIASIAVRDGPAMRVDAGAGGALHGQGAGARVEATAVAALAALRIARPDALPAAPLLEAIARDRHADGTWGTTHATVLALRAQLAADPARAATDARLVLRAGERERALSIPAAQRDLERVVDVSDLLAPGGAVSLEMTASEGVAAALAVHAAEAFDAPDPPDAPLRLAVLPGRTTCALGESLPLTVRLATRTARPVAMPLVQVPLPAGFVADALSLENLRRVAGVERVESDARSVAIYLRELRAEAPLTCAFVVRPRLRGRVTAVPASAIAYYEPESAAHAAPATFTVR